ncbi:hypothetical protein GCM10027275_32230 [Rhabdobacter roseus]|uniref:DUF3592 domain-containing protein n=1 Tax=Rhabdobacter roseus TaxID=1655419 RepID=A0A840TV90_9BACT|nr:hypothetical protein [Rhabdobacter roseus]MBB5285183.1 hypothetical protein [Rhabdobacter roseus]
MKSYIYIIISFFFVLGGFSLIKDHFSDAERQRWQESIASYEKLVANPVKTEAFLDNVYKERTIKVMGLPMKSYKMKYFFLVDGRTYEGTYTSNTSPEKTFITINYLAENPSTNAINPERVLQGLKDDESSNFNLYLGIGALLLGIFGMLGSVQEIRDEKKAKEEETLRLIDERNSQLFGS